MDSLLVPEVRSSHKIDTFQFVVCPKSISRPLKWLFWVLLSSLSLLSWKKICYAPHCHSNLSLFSLQSLAINYKKKEPLPHCYCTLSSKRRKAEKSSETHFLHGKDGLGWSGNWQQFSFFFPASIFTVYISQYLNSKRKGTSPKLTFYRIKGRIQDLNKIIHPSRCKLLKQLQITLYTHSKYSHLLSLSREQIKSF